MIRFQLFGETPSKKNSKIWTKSKKLISSKAHQKWHSDALLQLNAQICRMGPDMPNMIDDPVAIKITFYHGDMIRRDSDNQTASIMDLLQDAKILEDDRWQIVRQLHIENEYDKGNARCVIELKKL